MAFEGLTERLQNAISKLKRKGKISESDVKEVMREIRLALLEADVNFKVVKDFVKEVKNRAVGAEVLESLTPAQQIVKIVNEELIKVMGECRFLEQIQKDSDSHHDGRTSRRRQNDYGRKTCIQT